MAQLSKGETFTDVSPGKSVTSTRLNNLVDAATILPGAITEQTDISTSLASDDLLLMSDTSASGALKKVQAQYLLTPQAITVRTDISTSLASDDLLLMSDTSASGALMKVQAQNLLVPEVVTAKTELTSVAQDDLFLVSDTSASGALKKVQAGNLLPRFTATGISLSTGVMYNSSHSLGATPRSVRVVLVMGATTELGYSANDEVDVSGTNNNAAGFCFTFGANSTNVFLVGDLSLGVYLANKTTGAASSITLARWTAKIYAFA